MWRVQKLTQKAAEPERWPQLTREYLTIREKSPDRTPPKHQSQKDLRAQFPTEQWHCHQWKRGKSDENFKDKIYLKVKDSEEINILIKALMCMKKNLSSC